jgi:hypothetical protein
MIRAGAHLREHEGGGRGGQRGRGISGAMGESASSLQTRVRPSRLRDSRTWVRMVAPVTRRSVGSGAERRRVADQWALGARITVHTP